MKKTIKSITLIMTIMISSIAYSQSMKDYNIDNSNIALEGYSPVSYLDLGIAQKGSKEFKSEYDKVYYYFTSEKQKMKFDKNPEKYLPQYGGYCAFGVCAGAKFRPDPNKFVVKDGKYYLFLNNIELDAQQLWLEKEHGDMVEGANKNWKKLGKAK